MEYFFERSWSHTREKYAKKIVGGNLNTAIFIIKSQKQIINLIYTVSASATLVLQSVWSVIFADINKLDF